MGEGRYAISSEVLLNKFQKLLFPGFHDAASFMAALVNYLSLLLPILSAVVGFATIVYQALLKKILDDIGNKLKAAVAGGSDLG